MMLWMPANCLLDKSYVEIIRCQNGKRKEKHHLILRSEKRAALGETGLVYCHQYNSIAIRELLLLLCPAFRRHTKPLRTVIDE